MVVTVICRKQFKKSDLLVARAVVMPSKVVPVHLLNPTGASDNLYSDNEVSFTNTINISSM